MDRKIVRAWVNGWVVSRGAAPPVEQPWGFTLDVGLPRHVTRHVLPDADEGIVRKLLETSPPATWLKLFVAEETIAPWLSRDWSFDDPGFLMSADLRPAATQIPDGYRMRTWTSGRVTRALVVAHDGSFAARGQVARPASGGSSVAFDQIETAAAHRRRGLGQAVMRTLTNEVAHKGAVTGVLGSTLGGRALYESLGWRVRGPLTSVVRGPLPSKPGD